jgi:hypothetical protein
VLRFLAIALAVLALAGCGGGGHGGGDFAFADGNGWHTDSTGAHPKLPQAPTARASTIPLVEPAGSAPNATLAHLPANGIVISAFVYQRSSGLPPFPRHPLPLDLRQGRLLLSWPKQPSPRLSEVRILSQTKGRPLQVDVYFGTKRLTKPLIARAQRELRTLRLTG